MLEEIVVVKKGRGRPRLTDEERQKRAIERRLYQASLRETKPEVVKAYKKKWYEKNKDKIAEMYQVKKDLYQKYITV